MKKTKRLILLLTFLTGTAWGYLELFPLSSLNTDPDFSTEKTLSAKRSPHFKRVEDAASSTLPLPTKLNTNALILKYASLSPQETKEELLRLIDHEKHNEQTYCYNAIRYLAFKLGEQSPDEAREILQNRLKDEDYKSYLPYFLAGWAQTDMQAALDFLLAHKREWDYSSNLFDTLFFEWANRAPDKALEKLSSLSKGERRNALISIAGTFTNLNAENRINFISKLTPEDLQCAELRYKLASRWIYADCDSFKTWTGSLHGEIRKDLIQKGFSQLAQDNLSNATEELKKYPREDSFDIGTAITLSIDLEGKITGKALDWLLENRESINRLPELMQEVTSYYNNQPPEFTEKILQIPNGPVKDAALAGFLGTNAYFLKRNDENISGLTYPKIMELTSNISNPQVQKESILECLDYWTSSEPKEAKQWITEQSSFTEQEKQKLIQDCDEELKYLKEAQDS